MYTYILPKNLYRRGGLLTICIINELLRCRRGGRHQYVPAFDATGPWFNTRVCLC